MIVPIYLSEVSPVDIRGRLVVLNTVMITFGQFLAYLIAIWC